ALLEYARETLTAADIEVCHWHLQNFAPEDLLYARFDNPALQTLNEQLAGADGLIIATPVYKASFSGALKTLLGREVMHAFFDARRGFDVAAMAALSGTLRAGSWLVLLTPPFADWPTRADEDSLRW
ncbi:NAD(P)H-dependent oxidoreductase, partial [Pseudomonas aeruginosa]|nr:NAD(P)H-dependent oxidoreductase [Pseudomonas aeruginosa]